MSATVSELPTAPASAREVTSQAGQGQATGGKPRIVIVGAGFAGLSCAKALARADADITLIDRRNYHLFQPLLYQVATAALSPADIAWPIRGILSSQRNASVLLGSVTGVDVTEKAVLMGERRIPYDYLVLATGVRHSYFGRDDWEPHAPGLKRIEDATEIRRRILIAFERAEAASDMETRRQHLTFVVVGGGPTGVEMAGAIAELARHALTCDFRKIDPTVARIILIEAGPRLLASFPEPLSKIARWSLERLGVQVLTGVRVERVDANGVGFGTDQIGSRTVIWAAGVEASPVANWLGREGDRAKRLSVEGDLTAPGLPDVFVIGDAAIAMGKHKGAAPGIAPAAKQMGVYAARAILRRLAGKKPLKPFFYRHYGDLATIGRKSAVVNFDFWRLSGFPAWVLWSIAHIYFLIGFKNRMVVALNWIWNYVTFQRGARLITGPMD